MQLSETIITKLFDTLSKSIDDNKTTLDKLVDAQVDSSNYLKPKINTVEKNSNIILDMLTRMSTKITIMIAAVGIACTILGIIYLIGKMIIPIP